MERRGGRGKVVLLRLVKQNGWMNFECRIEGLI